MPFRNDGLSFLATFVFVNDLMNLFLNQLTHLCIIVEVLLL